MGQYRLSMYLNKQIGLMLVYRGYSIDIMIPFISVHIATTKHAKGYNIFNLFMDSAIISK